MNAIQWTVREAEKIQPALVTTTKRRSNQPMPTWLRLEILSLLDDEHSHDDIASRTGTSASAVYRVSQQQKKLNQGKE